MENKPLAFSSGGHRAAILREAGLLVLAMTEYDRSARNTGNYAAVPLILLIDDDPFYRSVIRRILEDGGYRVVEAPDGMEGLESYKTYKPTLVITDMRMPGMDGAEVIRSIREMEPGARIIAVSGAATFYNVDYFKLAEEVGADVVLRKLDPMDRVLVEVNRVLKAA
jgi:phosphoserine phosphatase RsbU/P